MPWRPWRWPPRLQPPCRLEWRPRVLPRPLGDRCAGWQHMQRVRRVGAHAGLRLRWPAWRRTVSSTSVRLSRRPRRAMRHSGLAYVRAWPRPLRLHPLFWPPMLPAPPLPPLSARQPQLPCCPLLTPLPPPPSVTLFWSAPMLLRFRSRSPQMNAVAGHSDVSPAHAFLTTYLRVSACPRSLPTVILAAYALALGRHWEGGGGPVLGRWLRRRRRRRWRRWRRRRRPARALLVLF